MKRSALKRKAPMKQRQPRRDWSEARSKVDREKRCRLYRHDLGCAGALEAAHVIGREMDKRPELIYAAGEYAEWFVAPDRIVPLCRIHHRAYDDHEIDLLPALHLWEQIQAIIDAGGLELARRRTAPLAYREDPS